MPAWHYFTKPTNTACHNLCDSLLPPINFRALLGLGLTFCPRPRYTNFDMTETCERFRKDIFTASFMAHLDNPVPRLFLRSDWEPPKSLVNFSLQRRVQNFTKAIKATFIKKRTRSNMLPYQRFLLATLRKSSDFVIFPADKNLGPCIIERERYIKRAFEDHLNDDTTYQRLSEAEANNRIKTLRRIMDNFLENYKNKILKEDWKFIKRSLIVEDPFAKFYLTAKVHKKPWKTRPIVSISGSLLHGLGRWVDKILQPFARTIPSHIKSLVKLKDLLISMPPLPPTARLFTCDAVAMYTNIDTSHAIINIRQHIRLNPMTSTLSERTAVMEALHIVMYNNLFQFGDTFWLQTDGTAMGVSPSCTYATLYFADYENKMKTKYPELTFYKRYIDDVFGIWTPATLNDDYRWKSFQHDMNNHGKLKWEFTDRVMKINFLDIEIAIDTNGKFTTKLYEKPENLYLYLPANTNHPANCLKGLVHGMVFRTLRLTSCPKQQQQEMQNLSRRLLARGYSQTLIVNTINKAYHKITQQQQTQQTEQSDLTAEDSEKRCFFHLIYHPSDPPSRDIQQLFLDEVYHQNKLPDLPDLPNHLKHKIGINRLIIAYHRPPNLGNLLSPRILRAENGPLVSSYLTRN
jgi:hypothetical protein